MKCSSSNNVSHVLHQCFVFVFTRIRKEMMRVGTTTSFHSSGKDLVRTFRFLLSQFSYRSQDSVFSKESVELSPTLSSLPDIW